MNKNEILTGPALLTYDNPKKIIFMLHGFGDSAENFIHIANFLDQPELEANYFALNAPSIISEYSLGRQWFDLYPNGIYIANAGIDEIKIIQSDILTTSKLLENTVNQIMSSYKLTYKDCLMLGFSQGAMMTFEFGNYFKNSLGGLAIMSGRIISEDDITNQSLLKTPIFISHGDKDEVLPINMFENSCNFLKKNKLIYESYKLYGDTHTISPKAIKLLQKFIKKNL